MGTETENRERHPDGRRVLIAAGGTAGHVVPALAVAEVLTADGYEVTFAGARGRAEAELVPEAGYPIELLDLAGIDRRNPIKAAHAVALAARSLPRAGDLVERISPSVVVGGGGFVAGPVGLAVGADAPEGHFALVDRKSVALGPLHARGLTDHAVHVGHRAADPADDVVVVVADSILVASDRAARLDAAHEIPLDEHAEGVVHRLTGDRAELRPDDVGEFLGRCVRMFGDRTHYADALCGDLETTIAQLSSEIGCGGIIHVL